MSDSNTVRNLIYFICPISENSEWEANVSELRPYLRLFNGRRIVSIATGSGLVSPTRVRRTFDDSVKIEFFEVQNDPSLAEVRPFMRMVERVESLRPQELTFYAHAKGVSPRKNAAHLAAVRRWRHLMYAYCLSDVWRIESVLADAPCCGCFKKYGTRAPVYAPWHFSGTFFWFRNHSLFSNANWRRIVINKHGVEAYLSQFFDADQAACLFGDNPSPNNLYLYSDQNWRQWYKRSATEDGKSAKR